MPRKSPARGIEAAGFVLTDEIRRELRDKFPRVDLDRTYEIFKDKALANGWLYASWPAAFRNFIRNGPKYGGVEYLPGMQDPRFDHLIAKAKAIGFRMPNRIDSVSTYHQALEEFDKKSATKASVQLGLDVLKRVPKLNF